MEKMLLDAMPGFEITAWRRYTLFISELANQKEQNVVGKLATEKIQIWMPMISP